MSIESILHNGTSEINSSNNDSSKNYFLNITDFDSKYI